MVAVVEFELCTVPQLTVQLVTPQAPLIVKVCVVPAVAELTPPMEQRKHGSGFPAKADIQVVIESTKVVKIYLSMIMIFIGVKTVTDY